MGERGEGLQPDKLPEHMEGQPAGPQLETEESKAEYAAQQAATNAANAPQGTPTPSEDGSGDAPKTNLQV